MLTWYKRLQGDDYENKLWIVDFKNIIWELKNFFLKQRKTNHLLNRKLYNIIFSGIVDFKNIIGR